MTNVSIITATLNRPSLKDACESINNQTFKKWHHYVLGDGLLPIDYAHPQRSTIGFTVSLGATQPARNMPEGTPNAILDWALKHLDLGDYLCFLDDDNVYKSSFLEKMVNTLENNPECGIVICGVENKRGEWQDIDGYPEYRRCDNSGFMVHSKIAKEIGFPPAHPDKECVQDYEFIKKCADEYNWVRVPDKLVIFGQSPNPPPGRGGIKIIHSWSLPVKGLVQVKSGALSKGIEKLLSACKMDKEDAWSRWHLGEAYLMSGKTRKCIAIWKEWRNLLQQVNNWPHNWNFYCYALTSLLLNKEEEKEEYIEKAIIEIQNDKPEEKILINDKLLNLGLYYLLENNLKDSEYYYRNALKEQPDSLLLKEAIWNLRILKKISNKNQPFIDRIIKMIKEEYKDDDSN
ncbi:MAG: glycosyltransferase family 2 protein [Promethearchaeota archaeon]